MNESEIRGPFVVDLDDALADEWEKKIEEAEHDMREVRVNFRWTKSHLEVIKRAAARLGVPYQTYLKQAAMRAALSDLGMVKSRDLIEGPGESEKADRTPRHSSQPQKPTTPARQQTRSRR